MTGGKTNTFGHKGGRARVIGTLIPPKKMRIEPGLFSLKVASTCSYYNIEQAVSP